MMDIFIPTLNQIAYLFLLMLVGYIIIKVKIIPENSDKVLSKMENYLFIPALVLSTFMTNFKIDNIRVYGSFFLVGLLVSILGAFLATLITKLFFKNKNTYRYGLAFSNFGFMGNAVVLALFSDLFTEYLIFVLPFWLLVYLWGVPSILSEETNTKVSIKNRLKAFVNPMVISTLIGLFFGLINLKLPLFIESSITTLGNLMTPIAMIITGMTISKLEIVKSLKNIPIYLLSLIRLIIIPLIGIFVINLLDISDNLALCIIIVLSMPLGLNPVIVLNAYEKDVSEVSAMALISHALSLFTIPLIFTIFNYII